MNSILFRYSQRYVEVSASDHMTRDAVKLAVFDAGVAFASVQLSLYTSEASITSAMMSSIDLPLGVLNDTRTLYIVMDRLDRMRDRNETLAGSRQMREFRMLQLAQDHIRGSEKPSDSLMRELDDTELESIRAEDNSTVICSLRLRIRWGPFQDLKVPRLRFRDYMATDKLAVGDAIAGELVSRMQREDFFEGTSAYEVVVFLQATVDLFLGLYFPGIPALIYDSERVQRLLGELKIIEEEDWTWQWDQRSVWQQVEAQTQVPLGWHSVSTFPFATQQATSVSESDVQNEPYQPISTSQTGWLPDVSTLGLERKDSVGQHQGPPVFDSHNRVVSSNRGPPEPERKQQNAFSERTSEPRQPLLNGTNTMKIKGYRLRPEDFVCIGRVIALETPTEVVAEADGQGLERTSARDDGTPVSYHLCVFAITEKMGGRSFAVPIPSYERQGLRTRGMNKKDMEAHAIIYLEGQNPKRLFNEPISSKQAIAVLGAKEARHRMSDHASFINFGREYLVEHDANIMNVGKVTEDSMPYFAAYAAEEARPRTEEHVSTPGKQGDTSEDALRAHHLLPLFPDGAQLYRSSGT